MARLLDERKPRALYYGMLRTDQDDVKTSLGTQLYNHWDSSAAAPAKQRPREAEASPTLQVLTWRNGTATLPDSLVNKFPAHSWERAQILKLKEDLEKDFVSSVPAALEADSVPRSPSDAERAPILNGQPARLGSNNSLVRAVGRPDWSIEGGQKPIALDSEIRLECVPAASFGVARPVVARLLGFFFFLRVWKILCSYLLSWLIVPMPYASILDFSICIVFLMFVLCFYVEKIQSIYF